MFNGEPEIQTPFQGVCQALQIPAFGLRSALCQRPQAAEYRGTAAWIIIEASVKLKFHPEWD